MDELIGIASSLLDLSLTNFTTVAFVTDCILRCLEIFPKDCQQTVFEKSSSFVTNNVLCSISVP